MVILDWIVLVVYILLIIVMSVYVGRSQKTQEDYYLGGRAMPAWQIALSVMATQVSAISLIGAPAFIALKGNGGLIWLQYEFAIPFAMMLIMLVLVPMYHQTGVVSIYEYLEKRFGVATRSTLSLVFLISRGLGAGVALLATSIVTSVCLQMPLASTIILIGAVSLIYMTFGGIKADIYSDVIQLFILWIGAFVCIGILLELLGDQAFVFIAEERARLRVMDLRSTGLGDGQTFAFWPMLIGGLFLYLSYYGCDQSQTQRLLTTRTAQQAQRSLFMNGLLRFPLVLTYSSVGVLLLPFLRMNPDFAQRLQGNPPDFLVPYFLVEYMPKGLLGLLIAGIFAASMSSLDSALNSLSAATWRDFLEKFFPRLQKLSDKQTVLLSRGLTIGWGVLCTIFALRMIGGSETVLELVNKIGSAFYGPILATFWLGMLTRRTHQRGAITGLVIGVSVNIILWQFYQETVSWLWWNPIGFMVTFIIGYGTSILTSQQATTAIVPYTISFGKLRKQTTSRWFYIILSVAFFVMILIGWGLEQWLMYR